MHSTRMEKILVDSEGFRVAMRGQTEAKSLCRSKFLTEKSLESFGRLFLSPFDCHRLFGSRQTAAIWKQLSGKIDEIY